MTCHGYWTEPREVALASLWQQGHSAAMIAAELGGGVTRNAVIGKLGRLGLLGRGPQRKTTFRKPRKQNGRLPTRSRRLPPSAQLPRLAEPLPAETEIPETAVPLSWLHEGCCRFPYGERVPYLFCAKPVFGRTSWCERHLRSVVG